MKRISNLIPEIIDPNNIKYSIKYVLRGKRKNNLSAKRILNNIDFYVTKIQNIIKSGDLKLDQYNTMIVKEAGKLREIQTLPMLIRIIVNSLMNVVENHLTKRFIRTTASSIKFRGTHYLKNIIESDLRKHNLSLVYKCDVSKFYNSINRDLMMKVTEHYIKDKIVLKLLHSCIYMMPKGLSIGLRSSQLLGNLYLSYYVDHIIKDKYQCKYFYRYCDDIVILSNDKYELTKYIRILKDCINKAELKIKSNEQVFNLNNRSLDFLGFVIDNNKTLIRKHIKKRACRNLKRVKSKKRKQQLLASFYSYCKNSNGINLFNKVTNMNIHKFSEIGYDRNQKYFNVPIIKITELVGKRFIILDIQNNITTKFGDNKIVVKINLDGDIYKFISGDIHTKKSLSIAKKKNLLPIEATFGKGIDQDTGNEYFELKNYEDE